MLVDPGAAGEEGRRGGGGAQTGGADAAGAGARQLTAISGGVVHRHMVEDGVGGGDAARVGQLQKKWKVENEKTKNLMISAAFGGRAVVWLDSMFFTKFR